MSNRNTYINHVFEATVVALHKDNTFERWANFWKCVGRSLTGSYGMRETHSGLFQYFPLTYFEGVNILECPPIWVMKMLNNNSPIVECYLELRLAE